MWLKCDDLNLYFTFRFLRIFHLRQFLHLFFFNSAIIEPLNLVLRSLWTHNNPLSYFDWSAAKYISFKDVLNWSICVYFHIYSQIKGQTTGKNVFDKTLHECITTNVPRDVWQFNAIFLFHCCQRLHSDFERRDSSEQVYTKQSGSRTIKKQRRSKHGNDPLNKLTLSLDSQE